MDSKKANLKDLYKKDPYVYKNGTLINKLEMTYLDKLQ